MDTILTRTTQDSEPIHLIMGVSSVGKSTFIARKRKSGQWSDALPVLMAHDLEVGREEDWNRECIVHYNLFRHSQNRLDQMGADFLSDPVLVRLLSERGRVKATFLLSRRGTLAKRILLRTDAEPDFEQGINSYPSNDIFELLSGINLTDYCQQWFELLDKNEIEYEIVESESSDYRRLGTSEEAVRWLKQESRPNYEPDEIEVIKRRNRFEYHAVPLPGASKTSGDDRDETLVIVENFFPGRSILDIGCAYGFFCFEAERRKALEVVGTEVKRHRFIGASILKEILGSSCIFQFRDVFEHPLDRSFDVVLMLNVLHHLKEPVRALRMASRLANETLIIEFPTLSDEKFRTTMDGLETDTTNSLPLIGVSLLPEQDQTFLFSEAAIKRILTNHDALFASVEFLQSPISEHRRIAVCSK